MAGYTRQSTYTDGDIIDASDSNDEFDQLLAVFNATSGHTHDGTAAEGAAITKLLSNTLTFGAGSAGTDITITFDGESNDGVLKWMEDEDYFEFSDDLLIASTEKVQIRDTGIYLNSSTDGQLDVVADGEVQIASPIVDINASTGLALDGANLNSAWTVNTTNKIQFRDTGLYINSSTDGQLDIVADTEIQIAATTIDMNGAADISGNLAVGGNLTVAGNATVTGTTTFNGGTITIGDAATDNVVFGADVDSSIIPDDDDTYDLGSASQEWRDLYIDGTAHIDTLDVDANATVAGTLGVTGVLTTTATQVATGGITSGSNIVSDTDSTDDLGTTSVRWANLFVDGITATDQITATGFTGTLDGILGSGTAAAATVTTLDTSGAVNLNLTTDSTSSTSGALIVDGGVGIAKKLFVGTDLDVDGTTNLDAVDIDGAVQLDATLTVGANDQGYDVILYGDTASANMTWDTSADDLIFNGAAGLVVPDGQLTLGSTAVTSTAAELNLLDGVSGLVQADLTKLAAVDSTAAELNIVDGGTSATSTTVADADRVVLNDNGTMVQVAVTDLAAYFDDEITAMPNLVSTGALNTGSITSGFGTIDTGASNITTTGVGAFGSLDISGDIDVDGTTNLDVVDIDGAVDMASTLAVTGIATFTDDIIIGDGKTIGSASDVDAITIASNGQVTLTQTLIGTALDISGDIDVDGTTNLDVVDIDGAVNMATTLLVTGVATLTATPIANAGISVKNGATSAGFVEFFEDSDNGTNKVTLIGPASTADVTLTLPTTTGTLITSASAIDEATALAIALG
jgi:hypothetical protein